MKLTKLRIVGFKSFVEATEVAIEPGLTGVVGPNGCGKSNLVEALRWVMGESSHKSLRASGMDDVIFAGSGQRPARDMAEVTLAIDNSERRAPAGFNMHDTLEISRRIQREAGSVYRVNGREVRARDVQLLFADAATGARSHAMVRQGQIGEIIAAKPQARRRILEDAAGIAGLHGRRHEAELRLKAAEDNLLRLQDVLGQVDQQIDHLKRQARQAARYRAVSAEIRKAEALILYGSWLEAALAVTEATSRADADIRRLAERMADQAEAARAQAVGARQLPALREAEAAAGAAAQRLISARDRLDAEERRARERAVELERRAGELADDLARERALIEDAAGALERLGAEEAGLKRQEQEAGPAEAAARKRLAALEDALFDSEAALAAAQSALAELNARRAGGKQALREAEERVARLAREVEKLGLDHARIAQELSGDSELARLQGELEGVIAAAGKAQDAAEQARAAHERAREAEQRLAGPALEADREARRLETEARTLARLLSSGADRRFPPVVDKLQVARGFETAVGAALGEDLEAALDAAAPAFWGKTGSGAADPPLPEGVACLAEQVEAPPELARRLRQIGVVTREEGDLLREALRAGQRLVSREGDLWRWDGYTAGSDAPTPAARRLAERNRLAGLEVEAAAARRSADASRAELDAAEAATRIAAREETDAFESARMLRRGLDTARARHQGAERARAELSARLQGLADSQARAAADLREARESQAALASRLAQLPESSELEAALAQRKQTAGRDRQALGEAKLSLETLRREARANGQRSSAITEERAAWAKRRAQADGQIAQIERRRIDIENEAAALREAPDAFLRQRRALLSRIAEAERAKADAADRLAEAQTRQNAADRAAAASLDALALAREDKARSEARLDSAKARLAEIARIIAERLDATPEAVPALAGLAPGAPAPAQADLEYRLDQLRQERERLGAVNLRAEEELAEIAARRGRLAGEGEDLAEAIKRLRGAILNLNKEGRERLLAAFDKVQTHFERLFTSLFGGGFAQLELIESDDPLEAGLEIVAKPPGKKPQTMTLLSGGEQALTAIALIFAVFLTNPSPICVLDEVDAPLDDANVERYCDLLRDMADSTETRFIVITHNPITMARMNRLFGVTMAERGVSQLVSVDLEMADEIRQAS